MAYVKRNLDIRKRQRDAGLPLWLIAEKLSISEYTLIRWLRAELSEDKRRTILEAIDYLRGEEADGK